MAPVRHEAAFTLSEMLIAMGVLAILIVFTTRLFNGATNVSGVATKRIENVEHARALFQRMGLDFTQMLKRRDISYFVKAGDTNAAMSGGTKGVNDRIAFYTALPGYYSSNLRYNSTLSLTAYRVNADPASVSYNRVERMSKGLPLNAAYGGVTSLLFLDSPTAPTTTISAQWPSATRPFPDADYGTDPDYELAEPQVFRLEYYYLATTPAGTTSLAPYPASWTSTDAININDVEAIVVAIAVIDAKSNALLSATQLTALSESLQDYSAGLGPGELVGNWQDSLDANVTMPRPAITGVRLYERYFYLRR